MSAPSAKQQHILGIAFVVGAAACFAVMDTTIRHVGNFFSVALVLWARYGLHAAIMTVWIALSRGCGWANRCRGCAGPWWWVASSVR